MIRINPFIAYPITRWIGHVIRLVQLKRQLLLNHRGNVLLVCGLLISSTVFSQLPTAQQVAANMKIGWNHGNSMEVPGNETGWGNPPATQQLINGVKAAGFNTVRIPCAWDSYANQSTYQISPTWLARVKQVVDYCYNNNMYVILNSHWDGGWLEERPFYANQQQVNVKQHAYWTQVANYFAAYNERLLFAGTNEVRANYGEPTNEHITVQQSYNQTFINAVRATGGNNMQRTLIVQTYNTNAWHGLNYFTLPNDPASGRLMVEVHYYDAYDFTLNSNNNACPQWDAGNCSWAGASYVENLFGQMRQRWVNQGIPVVIGEYGATKRPSAGSAREAERLEWLEYITAATVRHGMIPVYWDNGVADQFGLFNRNNGNIIDQAGINALMAGAGAGCAPTTLTPYVQVNGGAWQGTTSISINSGDEIRFGPQPVSGGSWSWSGCGTSGTSREQTINPTSSCTATATFRNNCGSQSTLTFTINVSGSTGGGSYVQFQNRGTGLRLDGMGRTTNGDACGQYANTTSNNSQWQLIDVGSGYFQLRNRGTGLYLDGMGRTTNGSDVGQWANSTHRNSHWALQQYSGSYYRLQNRATGLYLDGMGRTSNGSAVGQYANTTSNNAQWQMISVSARIAAEAEEALSEPETVLFYPNPVNNVLNIRLQDNDGSVSARIFNVTGQLVISKRLTGLDNQIEMTELRGGVYFVEVSTDSGTKRSKLVKQ